jgi:hypothetical protein
VQLTPLELTQAANVPADTNEVAYPRIRAAERAVNWTIACLEEFDAVEPVQDAIFLYLSYSIHGANQR